MTRMPYTFCAAAVLLCFSGSTWTADAPVAGGHASSLDISGTYELVKRVLPDGREILAPAIGGLYTMTHGRRNFNGFSTAKDGKQASLSVIAHYTLIGGEYCEKRTFWLRNLAKAGVSNETPPPISSCSPVTMKDGKVTFQPAGEPVLSFDTDGLTATADGRFVDYWKKLR